MLEIIEYGKDEYSFPSLVVLGCFDAIHAGHRELFKKAKLQAKINGLDLGVMMFRGGKGGKQIYSFEERVEMLKAYNVKFVLAIDFTPEFKQTMPLDFLAAIEEKVNVKAYMSGKDFRFGKGAKGKSSTLKNYAEDEENGVWYMPVKDVMSDGEKISTTLIKQCLDDGNVRRASELLGENFYVEGEVVEGAHRGTGVLGFPTVNLKYPEWKYPVKHGVYKVKVNVDGNEYLGIANFGGRPTFGDDAEVLEVHIKDFEGDLYGRTVKVSFVGFMRNIVKFDDASALAAQLEQDKSALALSDEKFFGLYPLEEGAPAIEEASSAELDKECEPPAEVFDGAPAEQPEVEYVAEQPEEPVAEIISEEQVAETVSNDITPAWELLSDEVNDGGETVEVTPSNVVEEISGETEELQPEEEAAQEVVEEAEEEISDELAPAQEAAEEAAEEIEQVQESQTSAEDAAAETVLASADEEQPEAEQPDEENTDETAGAEENAEPGQSSEESTDEVLKEEPAEEITTEVTDESESSGAPYETTDGATEETGDEICEELADDVVDVSGRTADESLDDVVGDTSVDLSEEAVDELSEENSEELSEEVAEEIAEEIAGEFSGETAEETEEIAEDIAEAEEAAEQALALAERNLALVEQKVALVEQKVSIVAQKTSMVIVESPKDDSSEDENTDAENSAEDDTERKDND